LPRLGFSNHYSNASTNAIMIKRKREEGREGPAGVCIVLHLGKLANVRGPMREGQKKGGRRCFWLSRIAKANGESKEERRGGGRKRGRRRDTAPAVFWWTLRRVFLLRNNARPNKRRKRKKKKGR